MKTKLVVFLAIAFIVYSCSKDKFQTKPQLEVKEVSNFFIPINGSTKVTLQFTDQEGDIDDSIWVKKQRLNLRVVQTFLDSLRFKVPEFPNNKKGELELVLSHASMVSALNPPNIPGTIPPQKESDTISVKMAIRDKAGNASDSVTVGTFVIQRN
jgi:hypothetical protein